MLRITRFLGIAALLCCLVGAAVADDLTASLAHARAGSTVILPAGVVKGGFLLPPGISLHGAGVGQTIIDATGVPVGLEIAGGAKATITDLTVLGATRIDISVHDCADVTVRNVRAANSINGVVFTHVTDGRFENVVSDGNRYGLVAGAGTRNVIVNCTAVRDSSLGISIPSGSDPVVFNNCVADSATGIYLGTGVTGAHIDYNLYSALYAGKLEGQLGRKSIGEWTFLCGQDVHSVTAPVAFANADGGDYRPTNALTWALDRTPVTATGVASYAGVKAPAGDITHARRRGAMDLGAYIAHLTAPRPADGKFVVRSGAGITSAGVFTKDGREVAYLFHNLPLTAGKYNFWLPTRDFQYAPIAAGSYEVRVTESRLTWDYMGHIGDTGPEEPYGADAPIGAARVAFDDKARLMAGNDGWAEDFIDVRGYDGPSGKYQWSFRAGADTKGLATAGNVCYVLRPDRITKLDVTTGQVIPWEGGKYSWSLPEGFHGNGITVLGDRLVVTDGSAVYFGPLNAPNFTQRIPVKGACCPSADEKRGQVLVLTDYKETLFAIRAGAGTSIEQVIPRVNGDVIDPCGLTVCNGRIAIASRKYGKIFLYKLPDHLGDLISSIGTGDGPFGAARPDRFTFQAAPGRTSWGPSMALSPAGDLAVGDANRLTVFDAAGKIRWSSFGVFGNGTVPAYGPTPRRYDTGGDWSFALDLKNGTWKPEALWSRAGLPAKAQFAGEMAVQGHTFGVYAIETKAGRGVEFTTIDGFTQTPLVQYAGVGKGAICRKDTNHDGTIDDADAAVPCDAGGLTFENPAPGPNGVLQTHGNGYSLIVWHIAGLDADGAPLLAPAATTSWPWNGKGFISPYTAKPDGLEPAGTAPFGDGTLGALVRTYAAPGGTGLFNGAGTDMAGFDAAGHLRWLHPLAMHKGLYNFQTLGPVGFSGVGQTCEVVCVDKDGLGLGTLGQAAISHYGGYWLDHPGAVQGWQGQDGRYNLLLADNFNGMHHWFRLGNEGAILHGTAAVVVSPALAATLAALPAPDPNLAAQRPATPIVTLPRLKAPLPIDGELGKWRTAGITPNIIITPDTAVTGIDGPLDASAVIRMAYFDKDLYVQILRFDENPVFFQPASRHYLQPCVEMCLNGFGPGFKFDISKTTDAGDMIIRQRFFYGKLERLLAADHAPRVIKILDSAADVSERAMIESVYGVDLAKDKVIVTEFKLPMDAVTYEGAEKDAPPMTPGSSFWLGFMIDDNNQPGADLQNLMVWPATYGTFNPPEDGAKAVLGE